LVADFLGAAFCFLDFVDEDFFLAAMSKAYRDLSKTRLES
jgi:hypothetical protein